MEMKKLNWNDGAEKCLRLQVKTKTSGCVNGKSENELGF